MILGPLRPLLACPDVHFGGAERKALSVQALNRQVEESWAWPPETGFQPNSTT